MIFDAFRYVQDKLEAYIQEVEDPAPEGTVVVLDNIGLAEELGGNRENLSGQIVMSLVNLQEESALKNVPNLHQTNGNFTYQSPPVHLNLFVLFSALSASSDQYETALKRLSRVIEFFQWQKEISATTSPLSGDIISREIRILPELYTLTFEQLNHLWGALGGKQVPFALYGW